MATADLEHSVSFLGEMGKTSAIPLPDAKGTPLCFVMLIHWDNVIGPSCLTSWQNHSAKQMFSEKTSSLLASISLQGQPAVEDFKGNETSIISLEEQHLCMVSIKFSAFTEKNGWMCHALSLVFPDDEMHLCIKRLPMFESWADRIISRFRILYAKMDLSLALSDLTAHLQEFCQVWRSLQIVDLSAKIILADTLLMDCTSSKDFVQNALLGHMITSCRTVVLGTSCSKVMMLLRALLMMVPEQSRLLCRGVEDGHPSVYSPLLLLQGLVRQDKAELQCCVSAARLNLAPGPTCVINSVTEEVMHTALLPDHVTRHRDQLNHELRRLWHGHGRRTDAGSVKNLQPVPKLRSDLVTEFVDKLCSLSGQSTALEHLVQLTLAAWYSRAAALDELVQRQSDNGAMRRLVPLPEVRRELGLQQDGDFRMILGLAETLRSGLSCYLLGDAE